MTEPLKQTMLRSVRSDIDALRLCDAMLAVGADPFSIVYQPTLVDAMTRQPFQSTMPFIVFAKVADKEMIEAVDREYERITS